MRRVPIVLMALRAVLGPALFVLILAGCPQAFSAGLMAGLTSDVLDGVVARRTNAVTDRLREADSWIDTWFYLWALAGVGLTHRALLQQYGAPLCLVASTQLLSWLVDLLKFRRLTTYHAYTAKVWGLIIVLTLIAVVTVGWSWSVLLSVAMGVVSHIDTIAMTLLLPVWQVDIAGVHRVLSIRSRRKP